MQIYSLIDPYALRQDGSKPLTADWNAGGFSITAVKSLAIVSAGDAYGTASLSNSTVTTATTFTGLDLSYIKTAGGNVTGDFVGISASLNYNENTTLTGEMNVADFSATLTQGTMNDSVSIFKNIFTQNSGTLDANAYVFYNKATLTGGTADDDVIGGYFNISQGAGHTAINDLKVVEITGSALGTVSGTAYGLYIGGLTTFDYAIWDDSGKPWALDRDNQKILFGGGQDGAIYYDGTDLVIDPKEVGTGSVNLNDGDLTTTGAGHFGSALDTDSTLVVDGNAAIGTTLVVLQESNVYKSSSTFPIGGYFSVNYNGTAQSCYGIYCQALGRSTDTNPRAYGARFQGQNYRMYNQTGEAATYGGDFRAQDAILAGGTHYGDNGGNYRFYCGFFYTPDATGDWTTNDPTVITYRLYLADTPTGFGDNHTDYAIYSAGGQSVHAGNLRIGSVVVPTVALDVTGDIHATGWFRSNDTDYRRYYHLPIASFDPGVSGAAWTDADANTVGGWKLSASTDTLEFGVDIHADWDAASDLIVNIYFAVSDATTVNNDTVDLKLVCYYNGVGETATKTQTVEVATTTDGTQWKVYKATFTINYDETDNVVQVGDLISFVLNLETDTSEVNDVIILQGGGSFHYNTTHIGIESGDT